MKAAGLALRLDEGALLELLSADTALLQGLFQGLLGLAPAGSRAVDVR